jgi:hypothetical protein
VRRSRDTGRGCFRPLPDPAGSPKRCVAAKILFGPLDRLPVCGQLGSALDDFEFLPSVIDSGSHSRQNLAQNRSHRLEKPARPATEFGPPPAVLYRESVSGETLWIPAGLEPVALRLSRADEAAFAVARLALEWSRNGGNGPLEMLQVENPPGILSLVVARVRPIPPTIVLLFSEAIHHLRAALDNAVFHLVEQEQGPLDDDRARRVAMRIDEDEAAFSKWLSSNDKVGLAALGHKSALAARMRALQPFASGDTLPSVPEPLATLMGCKIDRVHPLLLLKGYSNEDKHRAIRAAAARAVVRRDDQPFAGSDRTMRPVQAGDVLSVTPTGVPVGVDTQAAIHVRRPGGTAWVAPSSELDRLRSYVAGAIPSLLGCDGGQRTFPPKIDLTDNGQTDRERIESASWDSAAERMKPIAYQAFGEAITAPAAVPPIVPSRQDSRSAPPSGA